MKIYYDRTKDFPIQVYQQACWFMTAVLVCTESMTTLRQAFYFIREIVNREVSVKYILLILLLKFRNALDEETWSIRFNT